jgi:diacylglycerol kinase (ATP)
VTVLSASTRDEALAACRSAVADGAGALVAVGGDGTVHVGLQAVAGTGVPYGVIPAGTGNDFATESGVPADPVAAATLVAEALAAGRTRPVDLAHMAGPDGYERWFCAVLGAGFDAIVNERANAMSWPKGRRRYDRGHLRRVAAAAPAPLPDHPRRRDTGAGRGPGRGRQHRHLRRRDAHVSRRRPDRRAAGRGGGRPDLADHPAPAAAQGLPGHPRQAPRGDVLPGRTVSIEAEGITAYADGERTCPLPITVTAHAGALRLLV